MQVDNKSREREVQEKIRRLLEARKITPTRLQERRGEEKQTRLTTFESPVAKKKHSQNWSAYDKAKTNEDPIFRQLVLELALAIQKQAPPKQRRGRTGFHPWEKLVAILFKEYYRGDMRKTASMLKTAVQGKLLSRAPSYGSISNFYNDPSLTEEFKKLLLVTALPLAPFETVGAADSTGFGLRKYLSWNEEKWVKKKDGRRAFVKGSIFAGVNTNTIVSAHVTPGFNHDAPILPTLLKGVTQYFDFQEFVADKAYNSRAIMTLVASLGMIPFIPFKTNSIPAQATNTVYGCMSLLFHQDRELYDEHYHKRSNVESCFHTTKQDYGHNLLTKNEKANENEILARFVCQNICTLIQESFERGFIFDLNDCLKRLNLV